MTEEEDNDQRPGETEEDMKTRKRKERLEQNRISARESRKRKKTMIEELQRTVITLSKENKELNERNEQLRRQLMEIGAKVRSFISLDETEAYRLASSYRASSALVTCRSCTDRDVEAKKCRDGEAARTVSFSPCLSLFFTLSPHNSLFTLTNTTTYRYFFNDNSTLTLCLSKPSWVRRLPPLRPVKLRRPPMVARRSLLSPAPRRMARSLPRLLPPLWAPSTP
jgi:hypothetical protein